MITVAHEASITGLKVAREIFDGFYNNNINLIINRLDQSDTKWSKIDIIKLKNNIGEIGSWRLMKKSATPSIEYLENGFIYTHRFPGNSRWLDWVIILTFTNKMGSIHHVKMNVLKYNI